MESTNAVNTSSKVVDLKLYKNKKRKQKQSYLLVGEHYERSDIPLRPDSNFNLSIKILSLSIPNPFTNMKMYLAIDNAGSICAFEEGEEYQWTPITTEHFVKVAEEFHEKKNTDS